MLINRYIFKELWGPFWLGLFVFTFVFLINKILKLTEMIINKGAGFGQVCLLVWYLLPSFLVLVIPSTVLLATLLGFGRMAADGEITALSSSGVSFYHMLRPALIFGLVGYAVAAYLAFTAVPEANLYFKKALYDVASSSAAFEIQERVFIKDFSKLVIYVDRVSTSGKALKGIMVADNTAAQPSLIMARQGEVVTNPQTRRISLKLEDGKIHQSISAQRFRQIDFERYELNFEPGELVEKKSPKSRERELTFSQLTDNLKRCRQAGQPCQSLELELHKRLSLPLAALLVCFVGAPLGARSRSTSASAGVGLSLLIIFAYYVILKTGESLAEAGKFSPLLAMWLPNIFLAAMGGYLVYKVNHNSRIGFLDWFGDLAAEIRRRFKK